MYTIFNFIWLIENYQVVKKKDQDFKKVLMSALNLLLKKISIAVYNQFYTF